MDTKKTLLFLVVIISLVDLSKQADICRALVLDGDSDFGAYQAGAINGLLQGLKDEAQWDVISGVGIGALNAAGIAQFAQGEEGKISEWLLELWSTLTMDDLYNSWTPGGLVHGIHYGAGVFDSDTTTQEYLRKKIQIDPQRKLSILTCQASTGEFFRSDEQSNITQIRDIVQSSLSPTFLNAYLLQAINMTSSTYNVYLDGSTCQTADISGAIKKCREIVNDDSQIHLTLVYSDNDQISQYSSSGSAFDIYNRRNKIRNIRRFYREIVVAKETFTQVNFDYVVAPSTALKQSYFPFFYDFTHGSNEKYKIDLIKLGQTDAQNAIKSGQNSFDTLYTKGISQQKMDNDVADQKKNLQITLPNINQENIVEL